jgi:WD40 repeat protein
MTTSQVRDRIAAAAAIRADTTSDLIKGLLRGSGKAQVILIDALDEASDPSDLIKGLLNPLIKECSGRIRLIIGTRPYLLTGQLLGKPGTGPYASVNLDSEEYADPQSMRSYIRRILLSADSLDSAYRPSGLYSSARPSVLGDITHAIAAAAGTSFLVARIAGATEATASRLPDPDDASWRAALPRHAGEAMQRDLRLRLGADADKAAQLLLPLAYAQGGGMPWENVWPRLADDLSPGHNYGNEELMWLRRAAGSYAVEGVVGGRSVYRLYHQALADYLVQGRKQRDDQQTIARALIGLVQPGRGGSPAWADAHPYIRAHLATHAAGGGCLDPLLDDPDYLLAAARPQLNAALGAAGSSQARRHAFTYRRAAHFLNTRPPSEWDSYLELAARCNGAPVLADRVSGHSPHRAWSARWSSWRPAMLPLYLLQGHTAPVNAVAVGELRGRAIVVSGSADKSVRVWDLVTGAAVGRPLDGHSAPVHAVAVGEVHGRPVVVSGSADKSVRVWDLENGTAIGKRLVGESSVHAVAVADRHGRPMLVSGCADGAIQLWDLEGGAQMYRLTGHSATVHAVTTAELNGRPVVLSGSVDGDVGVWDLETGAAVGEMFTDHTASVMQIDSDDLGGRPLLITRSQDLTRLRSRSAEPDKPLVQVWNLESRSSVGRTFAGHTDMPREAKMARVRGQLMVASGSRDGRVLIWSPDSDAWGPPLVTFAPGAVATTALTELQGRPAVVMGGRDGNIQVWDLEAFPPEEQAFEGFSRGVTSMVVTQLQGRTVLVIGCRNGIIHVLDLETAGSIRQFGNQKSAVRSLALAHLHGRPAVVSGSGDGKLRVWDLETGKSIVQPFGDHVGEINAVATADLDGRLVVISGGRDRVVKVWDLEACTMIGQPFTRHLSAVHALAVDEFRGEQVVISAGAERGIRVWDLKTSAEISRSLAGHPGEVHALATARLEGRHVVVSGGTDRSVRVWDLESGAAVGQPLNSHTGWVTAMAVTERAGHQIVATGSSDHSVRLWDLKTGRAVRLHNSAHENWVRTVAITELKGRLVIVSAGDDSRIIARELATGAPVGQQLIRHTGPVHAAASTTVGGRPVLVTGGEDSTVRVWDLGTGAALTSPCRGHLGPVRTIAVTEVNGRPIAISGGDDHSVRLWDLVSGSPIGQPFTLHKRRVTAVAAGNLHGRPLVASADDFGVLTWDLETMRLVGPPFTNYSDSASVLTVISVRGRPIVLSGVGSAVLAWDPESGEIWQRFKNPQGPVTAVDFEEDSCTVVMLAHGSLTPAKLPFTAVRPLRLGRAFKLMSRPWKQAYSNNRQIRSSLARLTKPDRYIVSNGSKVVIRSISDTHSVDIGADILGLAISPPNCIIAISAQGIVVLDTMSGESWTL